ncbi:hypothetical protein K2P97_03475 [bacterium]|nr:hypothetical protein [bacterium]
MHYLSNKTSKTNFFLFQIFVCNIILFSSLTWAQNSTLREKCSQPQFACGECETKLQDDFNKLMGGYLEGFKPEERWSDKNDVMKIPADKKIEDFIAEATALMKKNNNGKVNMMLIGNSESLHETTPGNPRVTLKSPDGEFWLTYNTDPKAKGAQSVEIMRWDGKTGSYKFQELTFGKDGQPGQSDLSGKKCARCHREPMRPNWDTYRAWSNVIPPRDDLIEKGSDGKLDIAGRSYMSVMNRIMEDKKNGVKSRFAMMDVPGAGSDEENLAALNKSIENNGFFRVPHFPPKDQLNNYSQKTAPLAGSSHLGFDQLMGQNICMITNNLENNPNFNKFKYALAGAILCDKENKNIEWDNFKQYFPDSYESKAYNYFKTSSSLNLRNRKVNVPSVTGTLAAVYQHTLAAHKEVDEAKDKRAETMFRSYASLPEVGGSNAEVDQFLKKKTAVPYPYTAIADPGGVKSVAESDSGTIASLRYLLEPMGVNVGSWSMVTGQTVAQKTFSFSDQLLDMLREEPLFKSILDSVPGKNKTEKCDNIKIESRKAMAEKNENIDESDEINMKNRYLASLCEESKLESEIVAQRIRLDLGSSCTECHSYTHTYVEDLFSSDSAKRKAALSVKTSSGGNLKDHAQRMLREKRMPPGGFNIGTNAQEISRNNAFRRDALNLYIDYIAGDKKDLCKSDSSSIFDFFKKSDSKSGEKNKGTAR